jgi:hypothetical protein
MFSLMGFNAARTFTVIGDPSEVVGQYVVSFHPLHKQLLRYQSRPVLWAAYLSDNAVAILCLCRAPLFLTRREVAEKFHLFCTNIWAAMPPGSQSKVVCKNGSAYVR